MPKKYTIDVSLKSIVLVLSSLAFIVLFQHIFPIFLTVFVAVLIYVAINPLVDFLNRKRVPRGISAFISLIIIFSLLIAGLVSLVVPLISQTRAFIDQFPTIIEKLTPLKDQFDFKSLFAPQVSQAPMNIFKLALNTFSGIVSFFTVIVICFYMLQDRPHLKENIEAVFGKKKVEKYYSLAVELETRLGSWVRGELILMLVVGLLSYLGFVLIGLPNAVPLAFIAGLLELVPNIGPTIAAIPAVLVGFSISPSHGFLTILSSIIVQQLENNLIVPKIMQKAIGLHPLVTIISLMIGFKIGGPLLAVLTLPTVLSIQVILKHFKVDQISEVKELTTRIS